MKISVREIQGHRWLAMALLILLLAGCSTGGGSTKSRGRVSDAAAQSAEEDGGQGDGRTRTKIDHQDPQSPHYAGKREREYEEDDDGESFLGGFIAGLFFGGDDEEDEGTYYTDEAHDPGPPPAQDNEIPASESDIDISLSRHNVGFMYSLAFPAGDVYRNISTYSVVYSSYLGDKFRGHLGLYYGVGQQGSQPVVQDGIKSLNEFGVDLGFREYLTPSHTLIGVYLAFGAKIGGLSWAYSNEVSVPSDTGTDLITDDSVFLLTPYIGLGTSLFQIQSFHLGGSVCWGMRIAGGKTEEGFENDLFADVAEFRMNFGASFFF